MKGINIANIKTESVVLKQQVLDQNEEIPESQAIVKLIPEILAFIEQHFDKLSIICKVNDIKLLFLVATEQLHVIKNEEDVVAKLHYIGKKDSVTLASRILARGADIKVDHYITKGLHVIVTYYPPRRSVYTQMLGRTARQEEQGSYSVITMQKEKYAKGNPKWKRN